ncbi:MAG TPA: hypothetical protein VF255_03475 [Solirubrobacterales bacterium]
MNEQEQRDLARYLADTSNVLDFAAALQIVQLDLPQAEKLLRMREEGERTREEFARSRERRRRALLEFR